MKFARQIAVPAITATLAVFLAGFAGVSLAGAGTGATKSTLRARELVDVNHAGLEQLKALPGIQDALAAKIVKNRPYDNKTQLLSKGVIPAATYRNIRALIIAKQ